MKDPLNYLGILTIELASPFWMPVLFVIYVAVRTDFTKIEHITRKERIVMAVLEAIAVLVALFAFLTLRQLLIST